VRTSQILALSGGVGGAKLVDGLAHIASGAHITVVVNTADDFRRYGLHVSPDVDTVLYTLAGWANAGTGWGIAGDTDTVLQALRALGDDPWFRLMDRDLATHLYRTQVIADGGTLTEATLELSRALGVEVAVLPMTDDPVATRIRAGNGWIAFQDWYVRQHCEPPAEAIDYVGADGAAPSHRVTAALKGADVLIIGPSNPYLSVLPILSLAGVSELISACRVPVVAVSPIIGGNAVKGPAAEMLTAMAGESSARAVAEVYGGLLDGLVIDSADAGQRAAIQRGGTAVHVADILMRCPADRPRLAGEVLSFAESLR
jgi:LPPG:FO 2-phospho-L-lactate transferase